MTRNQIAFYEAKEKKRSNLVNENIASRTLMETARSNRAREGETNRHNLITEGQTNQSLSETKRSNLAKEYETARANRAKEYETWRSNYANERISNDRNIITGAYNSGYLSELARHNAESERLTSENQRAQLNLQTQQFHEQQTVNTSYINKLKADAALANENAYYAETYAAARAADASTNVVKTIFGAGTQWANMVSGVGGWIY